MIVHVVAVAVAAAPGSWGRCASWRGSAARATCASTWRRWPRPTSASPRSRTSCSTPARWRIGRRLDTTRCATCIAPSATRCPAPATLRDRRRPPAGADVWLELRSAAGQAARRPNSSSGTQACTGVSAGSTRGSTVRKYGSAKAASSGGGGVGRPVAVVLDNPADDHRPGADAGVERRQDAAEGRAAPRRIDVAHQVAEEERIGRSEAGAEHQRREHEDRRGCRPPPAARTPATTSTRHGSSTRRWPTRSPSRAT